jgi:Lipase (class 3)
LASALFQSRGKKAVTDTVVDTSEADAPLATEQPLESSATAHSDTNNSLSTKDCETTTEKEEATDEASILDEADNVEVEEADVQFEQNTVPKRTFPFRAPVFLGRGKKETVSVAAEESKNNDAYTGQAELAVNSDAQSEGEEVVAEESLLSQHTTVERKTSFAFLSTSIFGRTAASTEPDQDDRQVDSDTLEMDTPTFTEEQVVAAEAETNETTLRKSSLYFEDMASNFMKLIKGEAKTNEGEKAVSDIVASVREQIVQDDTEESTSLLEIIKLLKTYKGQIGEVAQKYVGTINLGKLSPTAVMYYVEREDEIKNPSWKRRQHRFCPGIKFEKVCELNDALELSLLCYADTADAIRDGLDKHRTPYDLVYVSVKSSPGQPANFVAVRRDQTSAHPMRKTSPNLYVVIGVRGTKTAADAVTDLLCDTVDYQGGKAHSFILESGKYIAEKHRGLLEELRVQTGKSKVKVKLIGHSLGAGAASIAGMELFGTSPKLQVQVIGFGCPALVSKDLAEKATYITTVVNDADIVPRMSGIAIANLLLDMMAFNWMPYAHRDIQHSLEEMRKRHSRIFKETTATKIVQTVEPLLEKHWNRTFLAERPARLEPEVYPPGKCIHFYRDGSGITGNYVPNTFFSEIDVTRRMIDGTLSMVRLLCECMSDRPHTQNALSAFSILQLCRSCLSLGLPKDSLGDRSPAGERPSLSL